MSEMVDLRCPVTPMRMFARVARGDASVQADGTIEVACTDCRSTLRKMGERVSLVVHVFNLLGDCVDTRREA